MGDVHGSGSEAAVVVPAAIALTLLISLVSDCLGKFFGPRPPDAR